VLEIDANVADGMDLVRRVREVMANTDRGELMIARTVPPSVEADLIADTAERAASMHHRVDEIQMPPVLAASSPIGRLKRLGKKAVRKATWWYVEPRWVPQRAFDTEAAQFATAVDAALSDLRSGLAESRAYARRVADRVRIHVLDTNDLVTTVGATQQAIRDVRTSLAELDQRLAELGSNYYERDDVDLLHSEVRTVLDRLGAASSSGADVDYVAFEDRFRGDSSELKRIQSEYLQYLPPPDESGLIVDVGSGRGEMLEVLLDAGYDTVGVEPDPGMVAFSHGKGLPVEQDNGLTWLKRRDEGSVGAVFCAQVVEHLFTSELVRFVSAARNALRPGGRLIMETINPRSWHALGNHFLADTTHIRPVHPETLRFICEQAGFARADLIERSRHELADAAEQLPAGPVRDLLGALLNSVYGFQDYAIIATK
jgi:O-antigen chain-terminating methyltransferase